MMHKLGILTLGTKDLIKSKNFYMHGFGWDSIHEDNETVMYQMNGFILSTWLQSKLEDDIGKFNLSRGGAVTLAHLVHSPEKVQEYLNKLSNYGGKIIKLSGRPSHGGKRGYVADPDEHIWEILYNPVWKINNEGLIKFSP